MKPCKSPHAFTNMCAPQKHTVCMLTAGSCTLSVQCAGAILQSRLKRLVYGAPQPRVGAHGSWIQMFPTQQHQADLAPSDQSSTCMCSPAQDGGQQQVQGAAKGHSGSSPHPFHPDIQVQGGVQKEEAAALIKAFFKGRRAASAVAKAKQKQQEQEQQEQQQEGSSMP